MQERWKWTLQWGCFKLDIKPGVTLELSYMYKRPLESDFCIAASIHALMAGAPLYTWHYDDDNSSTNRFQHPPFLICKCLWLDFLHPGAYIRLLLTVRDGEILYKPLLTWQSCKIMAAVTIADRRWSVISAVICTLVVNCIPILQLQRHHRSHIPLPTSSLLKNPGV